MTRCSGSIRGRLGPGVEGLRRFDRDLRRPTGPVHLVQAHRLVESLEHSLALIYELEPLADTQLGDDVRHQNLAGLRLSADAGRQIDRCAKKCLCRW